MTPALQKIESPGDTWVAMRVQIGEYTSHGVTDDFVEGPRSMDVAHLTIVAPEEYKGQRMDVLHMTPPPSNSPWRNAGAEYDVSVLVRFLKPGSVPGPGAVKFLSETRRSP